MGSPGQAGESVRLPDRLSGLSAKAFSGKPQVCCTYGRPEVPGGEDTAPKHVTIGRPDPDRPGCLIPNETFRKFFPGGFPA